MHLPKFTYYRLSSRAEAGRLLKEHGSHALLVAGGTDLYPRMKYCLVQPEIVISLKDLAVKNPEVDASGTLHLDPLMTMAAVASSSIIKEKFPILAQAAHSTASGQVRNMATLGGNICLENRCLYYNQSHTFQFVEPCFKRAGNHCYLSPQGKKCLAVFVADTVPALIALRTSLTLTDGEKVRSLPLENLYTGDALQPLCLEVGEQVADVLIPAAGAPAGMAFKKFSLRGGMEFAAFNLAAVLKLDSGHRTCTGVRLAVGAISQAPLRLARAEASLMGRQASPALFAEIANIATSEVSPLPHHGYSSSYLKECLGVYIRRTLGAAFTTIVTK